MGGSAAAILLAAGSGVRLGADRPKALVPLLGAPMIRWSALTLAGLGPVERLVVAAPDERSVPDVRAAIEGLSVPSEIVIGGARRRDSVRAGLKSVCDHDVVLVHDAARPLASAELAERVLAAAESVGAAVPVVRVPDALVRTRADRIEESLSREGVLAVQTPQCFRRELLESAHDAAPPEWDAPDDGSMVVRLGEPVATVDGDPENVKITWPGDVARAEAILASRGHGPGAPGDVRVGLGWDVHPLREGRPFLLVGVELCAELGPVGHSDGDPLSHAVADALLGAAALGDIGVLFPDDDPDCAGISGTKLLGETVAALARAGFAPHQVDAVIVTDRPKLSSHRDRVRESLARVLGLALDAVSVKGKRTEGLGGLAGGAGVACHAIARVRQVSRP